MALKSFGLSDIGVSRAKNEDVWTAIPEIGFFALADGMGGRNAGEVAAQETIEHLSQSISKVKTDDPLEMIIELRHAIEKANQWVYRLGKKEPSLSGMGTTLCCLVCTSRAIIYGHVGDSRVYRLRDQRLELLTQDHSLFARWQKTGKKSHTPYPYKNIITKAIGTTTSAEPEIALCTYKPGDLFFLCSDGLSDVMPSKEIEKILNDPLSLKKRTEELILAAKNKGSSDNITILMIQLDDEFEENLPRQQRVNSSGPAGSEGNAPRSDGPCGQSI